MNCSKMLVVNNYSNISLTKGTNSNGYVASWATTLNISSSNDSIVYLENDYVVEEFTNGEKILLTYVGDNKYHALPSVTKIEKNAFHKVLKQHK